MITLWCVSRVIGAENVLDMNYAENGKDAVVFLVSITSENALAYPTARLLDNFLLYLCFLPDGH
jgi:hypothetical protein